MSPAGIIVPTLIEAGQLPGMMSPREDFVVQGKKFHSGTLKERDVVLGICGIGKTNAAHGVTLMIERYRPDIIFIIGVAGAYPSSGLGIGDIAVAEREIYGDEGLLLDSGFMTMDAVGLPLATAGGMSHYNEFPLSVPGELAAHPHKGVFVTVSSCTGTLQRGREIEERFCALCENMEGAAVAHVCLLNGIPAVEIRGISNIIEDREGKPLDKAAILTAAGNVRQFFIENVFV